MDITERRRHLAGEHIGDIRVLCLLKTNFNYLQRKWLCVCLLCNRECEKTGHALLVHGKGQCCEGCRRKKHDAARVDAAGREVSASV